MHFRNVAEAVRYLRSEEGGSLRIQHTQVTRAAKVNATRDGYAFTFDEPSLRSLGRGPANRLYRRHHPAQPHVTVEEPLSARPRGSKWVAVAEVWVRCGCVITWA